MWSTLKILLFTTIMVVQSVLATLVYVPQPQCSPGSPSEKPSAFSISLTALHILSHLSFILPQFGGVTAIGEGSFSELKKVHYTALDILASNKEESERFVRELCDSSSARACSTTTGASQIFELISDRSSCIKTATSQLLTCEEGVRSRLH